MVSIDYDKIMMENSGFKSLAIQTHEKGKLNYKQITRKDVESRRKVEQSVGFDHNEDDHSKPKYEKTFDP